MVRERYQTEVHQKLIRNPFGTIAGEVAEEIHEQLIEFPNDRNCKDAFESDFLGQFWCFHTLEFENRFELSYAFLNNVFMRTRIFCFTDN